MQFESESRSRRRRPPIPSWTAALAGRISVASLMVSIGCVVVATTADASWAAERDNLSASVLSFTARYCADCHQQEEPAGNLRMPEQFEPAVKSATWEQILQKLRSRQMPPSDAIRPTEAEYAALESSLAAELDRIAADQPRPGRTDTLRRLNRSEYSNAIRDLLSLDIDATALLPGDESSHGFDNITVGTLSPTLLSRYIRAAQTISRIALGGNSRGPDGETFRLPADRTQEEHVDGLPLGTRGGALIDTHFARTGEFEVRVRLARDRNEQVEGMAEAHTMVILLDRREVARLEIQPPQSPDDHQHLDDHLAARFTVDAGPHALGVTFLRRSPSLLETRRQPYQAHFNMHRHPRQSPAVYQISITGPWGNSQAGDTPSRRRILVRQPKSPDDEISCAREVLRTLMYRAYRRPITDDDEQKPMQLFTRIREREGYEAGLEAAISSVLVSPNFLFRVEHQPANLSSGTAYRVNDFDLASRLSFFLWSSIPDDELLMLANTNRLHEEAILMAQVTRMLRDRRSDSLVDNFAAQWLHLRNLDSTTPDLRSFPDFDDNLRQSLRQETEHLLRHIQREDRSVLELLSADYTFLNERLAKHYGIPGIYGSHFRQVDVKSYERGGLLRQGSILTVTSYATRTSPVIRGKWILENLLGSPPPPPPANVPALKDNTVSANLSVRERLAAHRANAACASCHNVMDPLGFALENFDAVGRWRSQENGQPVDTTSELVTGQVLSGVADLERELLRRPELFLSTMAEKLLTFALGRELHYDDGPAIRQVVRHAQASDARFSSLIEGIVHSVPFQMRSTE